MTEALRIKPPDLEAFIARAFEAVDVPAADAKIIAELMARADVNGSEGHGVFRLPQYIRRIKGGAVNVRPNIRIERAAAAMALVERRQRHGPPRHALRGARSRSRKRRPPASRGSARSGAITPGPASLYASMPIDARHDRPLPRRRQREPPAAVGRARHAALDQSARGRRARGRRAADRARHGDDRRRVRQGEDQGAARRDDAGRLDDGPRRQAAHRSRSARTKASCCRSAITRVTASRSSSDCSPERSTAPRWAATSSISTPTTRRRPTPGTRSSRSRSRRSAASTEFKRSVDALVRDLRASKRLPGVDRIWLPGEQSLAKRVEQLKNGVPMPPALLTSSESARG